LTNKFIAQKRQKMIDKKGLTNWAARAARPTELG